MTKTSDFDYNLPPELIAQTPAEPRESARLMVLPRTTDDIHHEQVKDLPSHFRSGDVIVINNTKVFKARLKGTCRKPDGTEKEVELFLVRPTDEYSSPWKGEGRVRVSQEDTSTWLAIGKPGKWLKVGNEIHIADDFLAKIVDVNSDGTRIVSFPYNSDHVINLANRYGSVPVPPYIHDIPEESTYQTAYARVTGSVAAPTAGFHITNSILSQLKAKGVIIVEITLHVGLGTFLPVKSETIEDHTMHSEWVSISDTAAQTINQAKHEKRRVIAIGTTTVRALEGVAAQMKNEKGKMIKEQVCNAYEGDVNLFIKPGFEFRFIDGLLTNFHLPKSTLLLLVSTFAGRERVIKAYKEAVLHRYRFYSFGDAMLIL